MSQKITPFLWFDGCAEEATDFYVSILKNSSIVSVNRMGGDDGSVFMTSFILDGEQFMALNGGPEYRFSPVIFLFVNCETQAEVDDRGEKLSTRGKTNQCGWLDDEFGVSWRIIPKALGDLMSHPDPARAGRVMGAMLQMTKIDVAKLQQAHDQA